MVQEGAIKPLPAIQREIDNNIYSELICSDSMTLFLKRILDLRQQVIEHEALRDNLAKDMEQERLNTVMF